MAILVYLVIVSCFINLSQSQFFESDSIIFPDDDNELGSSCVRKTDDKLGICSKVQDCRTTQKHHIDDFCIYRDKTVCCSLENLYNAIDTRFGEDSKPVESQEVDKPEESQEAEKPEESQEAEKPEEDEKPEEPEKPELREIHVTQALIGELFQDERRIRWRCGGSLIAPRFVLTSAHCIYAVDIPTYIRVTTKDEEKQAIQQTDALIENIFIHPQHDPLKLYYDVGIIKLNKAIWGFQPVFLPTTDNLLKRSDLHVAGWLSTPEKPEEVKFVSDKVIMLPKANCSTYFNKLPELPEGIIGNQVCGLIADNSSLVPCSGAFLGPLETDTNAVVGIPSFTLGCNNDRPYVFTSIAPFTPWIKTVIDV